MELSRRDFFKQAGQGLLGLAALALPLGTAATQSWQDRVHDEFCRRYPNLAKAQVEVPYGCVGNWRFCDLNHKCSKSTDCWTDYWATITEEELEMIRSLK